MIGKREIIIKEVNKVKFFDSGRIDIFFKKLNDFWGPYVSCQNLSLRLNKFIKGDEKIVDFVDKKWIHQREME